MNLLSVPGELSRYRDSIWYRGSITSSAKMFTSSTQRSDRLWGPSCLLSNWYRGLLPEVKEAGRKIDRSPPSSAEVKNGGAMLPLPYTYTWRTASPLSRLKSVRRKASNKQQLA
jgi:hypothetical protein